MTNEPCKSSASVNQHYHAVLLGSEGQGNGWTFHVVGGVLVGGCAYCVWWAVIVHEWLRWVLLVVWGFWACAVVIIHGWSSLFHVVEGCHHLWVAGISGQLSLFMPVLCCCLWVQGMGAPRFSCVVVPISCHCGWLVQSFVGFETMCDSRVNHTHQQNPGTHVTGTGEAGVTNTQPAPTPATTCDANAQGFINPWHSLLSHCCHTLLFPALNLFQFFLSISFLFKVTWHLNIVQPFGVTAMKLSELLPCIIPFSSLSLLHTPPSYPLSHVSPRCCIFQTSILLHLDDCRHS